MRPRGKVIKSKEELNDSIKPVRLTDAINKWVVLAQTELAKFTNYTGDIPFPGWAFKSSDYDKNNRNLICLVKNDNVDGRQLEVQLDRRNHIATLIVNGTMHDRTLGLVGTDNRVVIKMLSEKSYDFVKSDDFIDRINMIFAAATHLAEAEKKNLSQDDLIALKLELDRSRESYLRLIHKECDFHTTDHAIRYSKDADKSQATKAAHKKFDDAIDIATKAVSASIDKCARLLESFRSTYQKDPKRSSIAEEIKHKEVELIAARGRPLDIKVSDIHVGEKAIKMVSAQMPLGAKTLPSSHRRGDDPDTKLSNHVRDFTGIVDENGAVQKRLEVDNHSSYCPIQQTDGPLRVWGSYLAAREKVMQLAVEQLAIKPESAVNGIEVNLTTLTLLSPYKSEKANAALQGKNSEYMQLKDIRTALNMLMYGPPLEVKVGNASIPVRLHASHMNLPVNVSGVKLTAVNPEMQKHINAKGFIEFKEKLSAQMLQLQEMKEAMDDRGQQLVDDLELYFANKSPRNTPRYIEASNIINVSHDELNDVYLKWFFVLSDYQQDQASAKPTGSPSKEDIVKIKNQAEIINNKIGNAYLDIEKEYELNFIKRTRVSNASLIQDLHRYLTNNNDLLPEPIRKNLTCLLHGMQAEQLYFDRFKNRDDQAYDYHVNYLLANYSFGQLVEFFCKSAEDRTGALRVKLFAHLMFEEINNRPPNMNDKDDAEKLATYLKFAHELSVSLENTKHNSEARGLQVKEIFTINGYNMSAGKLMAGLAKEPYDKTFVSGVELVAYIESKRAEKLTKPSALGFLGTRTRADRAASKETVSAGVSPAASPRASGVESPPKDSIGSLQRNRSGRLQLTNNAEESSRSKPPSPGRKG